MDVRKQIPNISLGTVYRNLNQLVEIGYIRKISNIGNEAHYDKIEPHDHMYCFKCKKIIDLKFRGSYNQRKIDVKSSLKSHSLVELKFGDEQRYSKPIAKYYKILYTNENCRIKV